MSYSWLKGIALPEAELVEEYLAFWSPLLSMSFWYGLFLFFFHKQRGVVNSTLHDSGYFVFLDTPDDAAVYMTRDSTSEASFLRPLWVPQQGKWGYTRTLRYVFVETGGYVAACNLSELFRILCLNCKVPTVFGN